ncbi:MAG: hydroxyacid dehydrogenase [Flavobacteriaceae bacterium]|nr:hydroxyacid dehydrogenase [Flavobacteriaceae bacterium]
MATPKILHLEKNHPHLIQNLSDLGFENIISYDSDLDEIQKLITSVEGLIIRSRIPIDSRILDHAKKLKFIARVGSGLENIHLSSDQAKRIKLISAPEGNSNAVGEHALGMLLTLLNKLYQANKSVCSHNWSREEFRGTELSGKTVGIIGYGHTGKAFAKNLFGFATKVYCYDILPQKGNLYAKQVPLKQIFQSADVISFHVSENPNSYHMLDSNFIHQMKKSFWLINTSRGSVVNTIDLVNGLKSKKIIGAGLDVLEYESKGFNSVFNQTKIPSALNYLIQSDQVILSPHVAGWTIESHLKLAQTIVRKIKALYQ